ncbi:helix-turn-helix domain-containing protein [Serratia marcescens]|uniref:helix-turn-helix domain-containing protein n=1 Tax=Serratia marcescens TaxID=615 RepID=UPI003906C253
MSIKPLLHRQGMSIRTIARQLSCSRETVRRYIRSPLPVADIEFHAETPDISATPNGVGCNINDGLTYRPPNAKILGTRKFRRFRRTPLIVRFRTAGLQTRPTHLRPRIQKIKKHGSYGPILCTVRSNLHSRSHGSRQCRQDIFPSETKIRRRHRHPFPLDF